MTTERQIAANRANALKGGVKTEAGKAISRLNARKHGIFALALTDEDAQQLRNIEADLIPDLKPVGVMEEILVEKMALTFMRMRRCARMEAEHYRMREQCNWTHGRVQRDQIVVTLGHYDIRLTNQFLRLSHELERLRQMRTARHDSPPPQDVSGLAQPFDKLRAVSNVERPPSAVLSASGSDMLGNDESQAGAPVPQETKNEPNSADAPLLDNAPALA